MSFIVRAYRLQAAASAAPSPCDRAIRPVAARSAARDTRPVKGPPIQLSTGYSYAAPAALRPFIARAAACRTANELAACAVDFIPSIFGTNACGVLLADAFGRTADAAILGMPDPAFETYETIWRPHDRVFLRVLERHVGVARRQEWSDAEWRRDAIYANFARRMDLFDYMSTPIFGSGGHLLGVTNFCRPERHRPFGSTDLHLATAMAGYLSAAFVRVGADRWSHANRSVALSRREREVALLAANGLSNPAIAASLQVARETVKQTLRRVYVKLEVNGRAQMAARLAELGCL